MKKYYSTERTKGLASEFKGFEYSMVVVLPDVKVVTEQICGCLDDFLGVVTSNPVYREILEDKATIVHLYEDERTKDGSN